MNGLRGEQAEPALRAMLERLYEDATSFGFPEERFERVYGEVELTLYRDAVRARLIAPLHGAWMHAERIELGDGLSLARGDAMEGPHDRTSLLCVLERDVPADDPIPAEEAGGALRLGRDRDAAVGARAACRSARPAGARPTRRAGSRSRSARAPVRAAASGCCPPATSRPSASSSRRSVSPSVRRTWRGRSTASRWAAAQETDAEALTDHLLGLRALLDATTETGQASFGLRLAALCAEEGSRGELQERMEAATRLERYVMGHSTGVGIDIESPRELVAEVEGHLRALLRDVLCGYLDADLKSVADDILIESHGEPLGEIEAHDLREEPEPDPDERVTPPDEPPRFHREAVPTFEEPMTFEPELEWEAEPDPSRTTRPEYDEAEYDDEPDTAEIEPVAVAAQPAEPVQHELDGVTQSADWGWDDPEDFSAPV